MKNDVKITSVTPAPGATITKGMTNSGSPGFRLPVVYTLVDGRTIQGTETSRKKKDLMPHIDSMNRAAAAGRVAASFNDDGKFWGTSQSFWIGGEPSPAVVAAPTSKVFRLVTRSSNCNSFGLRNHIFMAKDGHAFEGARSDGGHHRRQFDSTQTDYTFQLTDAGEVVTAPDGFELVRRLPQAPGNVASSVWNS